MPRHQAASRPPGGRGERRRQPPQQPQHAEGGSKRWAEQGKMSSAKYQMDMKRQTFVTADEAGYLGPPPSDPDLLQATLVIPGNHMLPRGLDKPGALDDICKKHKAWITRVQRNVFEVRCDNIRRLQEAVRDINQALHDMRLSNDDATTHFLVQRPVNVSDSALITVELNARPYVAAAVDTASGGQVLPVALDNLHQLYDRLVPSTDSLRALGTQLKMHVNFGRLKVRSRKRGLDNEMTYATLGRMMPQYSIRGGASMDFRLSDVQVADKVVQHLTDPGAGIYYHEQHGVQRRCTVVLKSQGHELVAETNAPSAGERIQLSAATFARPEGWPCLNWTVAAPDMKLDWNLQVDSCDLVAAAPPDLRALMGRIVLTSDGAAGSQATPGQLRPPLVSLTRPGGSEVDETTLKTSAVVPFKDTPFVVEVSVTQAWSHTKTNTKPDTWWGLEFYGMHWDEAINHVNPDERKKDWGAGLGDIWPGEDADLKPRFMAFLEHVVEIQAALRGVADLSAAMPQ